MSASAIVISGLMRARYLPGVSETGERLRQRMAAVGVEQEELARAVGCTQGAISQILTGATRNSRFLPRIAEFLGVSLAWLMGTAEEMQPEGAGVLLAPHERSLLDSVRHLSAADRDAVLHVSRSLARPSVRLPPEAALARMFEGLLAPLDPGASTKADLARTLAQRLPIGFAQLQDLLPTTDAEPSDEARETAAALPTDDREPRPARRT